jgi:hypothetical protein
VQRYVRGGVAATTQTRPKRQAMTTASVRRCACIDSIAAGPRGEPRLPSSDVDLATHEPRPFRSDIRYPMRQDGRARDPRALSNGIE